MIMLLLMNTHNCISLLLCVF